MIINKSGIAIRMAVEDLRVMGRATQGVRLIKVREDDSIAAVAKVMHDEDDIDGEDQESVNAASSETAESSGSQDSGSEPDASETPEQTED